MMGEMCLLFSCSSVIFVCRCRRRRRRTARKKICGKNFFCFCFQTKVVSTSRERERTSCLKFFNFFDLQNYLKGKS